MIEAELKARVREPDALRGRLRRLADEERSTYRDTSYDRPGRDLTAEGRELRVRVVETGTTRRTVLTYKEDGTFIELETMADEADLDAALADVLTVLHDLGVADDDLTTEQYTDAVMQARG